VVASSSVHAVSLTVSHACYDYACVLQLEALKEQGLQLRVVPPNVAWLDTAIHAEQWALRVLQITTRSSAAHADAMDTSDSSSSSSSTSAHLPSVSELTALIQEAREHNFSDARLATLTLVTCLSISRFEL
jgi:hypothetical protein